MAKEEIGAQGTGGFGSPVIREPLNDAFLWYAFAHSLDLPN